MNSGAGTAHHPQTSCPLPSAELLRYRLGLLELQWLREHVESMISELYSGGGTKKLFFDRLFR
jgi:hypothetical protein